MIQFAQRKILAYLVMTAYADHIAARWEDSGRYLSMTFLLGKTLYEITVEDNGDEDLRLRLFDCAEGSTCVEDADTGKFIDAVEDYFREN